MTNAGDFKSDALLPFYDDFHFPRGFARSGYFSLNQAEILSRYGRRLCALWKEDVQPETLSEKEFVEFCHGRKEMTTEYDRAWQSYLNAIKQMNSYIKING